MKKNTLISLTVVALVVAGVLAWNVFAIGTHWKLSRAVSDLMARRNVEKARQTLLNLNHRDMVLSSLDDALEDKGPVMGKYEVLATLSSMKESRRVERALDSKVPSTRYAAAYLLQDYYRLAADADGKQKVREAALQWLRDPKADARANAASLVLHLRIQEGIPDLVRVVGGNPAADPLLVQNAVTALGILAPGKVMDRALAFAKDDSCPTGVRIASLNFLSDADSAPKDQVEEVLLSLVRSDKTDGDLRLMASKDLGNERFADEKTWAVLKDIVLDDAKAHGSLKDQVEQRHSLESLRYAPRDMLAKILLDPRVYHHPYYPIRADAAIGYASLNVRNKVAYDVLCSLLVDTDNADFQHLVRVSAWTALWSLTGIAAGKPDQAEKFLRPPHLKPEVARKYMFDAWRLLGSGRLPSLLKMVKDLDRMKRVRSDYESVWAHVSSQWEKEKEAAAKKAEAQKDGKEGGAKEPSGKPEKGSGAAGGNEKTAGAAGTGKPG